MKFTLIPDVLEIVDAANNRVIDIFAREGNTVHGNVRGQGPQKFTLEAVQQLLNCCVTSPLTAEQAEILDLEQEA